MFGEAPPPANENQKLIFMSAIVLLLIGALVTMNSGGGDTEEKLASDAGQQEPAKDISIPSLDMNILNALVSDKTEESRVIQEEEGREFLLNYTGKLAAAHQLASTLRWSHAVFHGLADGVALLVDNVDNLPFLLVATGDDELAVWRLELERGKVFVAWHAFGQ